MFADSTTNTALCRWSLLFVFLSSSVQIPLSRYRKLEIQFASENRIFIWNTPKYSGCEDELAVQVQTPEHSGGADIIGRAGADLFGSAGAVNPAVQSFQPGQRIQSGPVREYTET